MREGIYRTQILNSSSLDDFHCHYKAEPMNSTLYFSEGMKPSIISKNLQQRVCINEWPLTQKEIGL